MATLLPALSAGAASVALAVSLYRIAGRLRELETRKEREASPPATPTPARASGPMLAALYREPAASPLSGVMALPGGGWMVGAVVLALLGLGTAAVSGSSESKAGATASSSDSVITMLTHRVDSLGSSMVVLRDSLRLALTTSAPAKSEPAPTRLARRVQPASGVVPSAPPPPITAP